MREHRTPASSEHAPAAWGKQRIVGGFKEQELRVTQTHSSNVTQPSRIIGDPNTALKSVARLVEGLGVGALWGLGFGKSMPSPF